MNWQSEYVVLIVKKIANILLFQINALYLHGILKQLFLSFGKRRTI